MGSDRRRGGRIGVVALVVLTGLVLGAAGGWAVARMAQPDAVAVSSRPLEATDPDVPAAVLTDDPRPALGTDLTYTGDSLSSAGTTWRLDRPEGWEKRSVDRGYRWVLPGNPDGTYSVRATPTPGSGTTSQLAGSRLQDIYAAQAAGDLSDVDVRGVTDDTVTLTYVQDGRLRYQHSQFLPASALPGGRSTSAVSVFEVSASGRLQDADGLDAVAEHMLTTVRKG